MGYANYPPQPPAAKGGNQAIVIGACAVFALLLLAGGYWAWTKFQGTGGKAEQQPARLYILPSISRESLGTGFMLMMGANFYFPVAVVTDSLAEKVPFSAGWKLEINRNSIVGAGADCVVLKKEGDKSLWIHRDGRLVENPEAIPTACDGDLLPAAPPAQIGACGYADRSTLKFRIQPAYQHCGRFAEELAPVLKNGRVGFINKSGVFAIPANLSSANPFSEGRAVVQQPGGPDYGYIDRSGKMVIPAQFSAAEPFQNGMAAVTVKATRKSGFIDPSGAFRIPAEFDTILTSFAEGRAFVMQNQKLRLIDTSGKTIAEWEGGQGAGEFDGGIAKVQVRGLIRLVDTNGRVRPGPEYREMGPFFLGYATAVNENGKTVLIDKTGKQVIGEGNGNLGSYQGKYVTRANPEYLDLLDLTGKPVLRVQNAQIIRDPKP